MKKIKIAHSPDTDDVFMFYALKEGLIPHLGFEFEFIAEDIGVLNQQAFDSVFDITALSFAAYMHLNDRYAILSSGASMAEDNYGPVLVSLEPTDLSDLKNKRIAIPGALTTATLILKMMLPPFESVVLPANEIINAVQKGTVAAGLVIHEGQIHFKQKKLSVVTQLIDYWKSFAGTLPLPLGLSVIQKKWPLKEAQTLSGFQKASIEYGLSHPEAATQYAQRAAPELSNEEATRYLSWYVNKRTLDLTAPEQVAMTLLWEKAYQMGLAPKPQTLEIIAPLS